MQRLQLREHRSYENKDLTQNEASALEALVSDLTIRPSRAGTGYDLETGSSVGAVRVGDLLVDIRPKIPIRRVLFLLSYSLDPAAWRDSEFPYRRMETLLDPLAHGFVRFCRAAVSRGLLRGYRQRQEARQSVRGRIRFDAQINQCFGRSPPVEVEYDEFTKDIAANRVLLAAVETLGQLRLRSRHLRRDLRSLRTAFRKVSLVNYRHHALPDITFTRLNAHYRPAFQLARLILDGASIRHQVGEVTSACFLVDMNTVFEDFVVVALREALGVNQRTFPHQAWGRSLRLDEANFIGLEPDLSWWRDGRCVFVGDVKYKQITASGIKHPDLYQLLAYTVATGLPSGMLIYADGEPGTTEHVVRGLGKRLEVKRLDLDQRPEAILADIDVLAREIRSNAHDLTRRTLEDHPV